MRSFLVRTVGRVRRNPAAVIVVAALLVATAIAVPVAVGASSAHNLTAKNASPSKPKPVVMGDYSASKFATPAAQLPSGLAAALSRDVHLTPAQYLANSAAAVQAVKVVAGLKASGVTVLGSKMEGTKLIVNVASPDDIPAAAAAGAIAVVGAPEAKDYSKVDFQAVSSTNTYGGAGYFYQEAGQTNGDGFRCSIGFNGYSVSTGSAQFATAGHCATTIDPNRPAILMAETAPTNAGGSPVLSATLGQTVSGQYGGNMDYGIVAEGAAVTPQASLYTWGGSQGAPLSSTPLPIVGETAGITGSTLCKSGSTTGWTCGSIESVDQSVQVSGQTVNAIVATTCLLPGDSGGGAVIGSMAVGIDSGGTFGNTCSTPGAISVFFPMVSAAGSNSVAGQQGSNWHLLAAPLVTTPTAGATVSASGSMTGTLFDPVPGSTVSLFLDGSSSPFATVSAASGSWVIPLTGVAQGAHTYSVSASSGWPSISLVTGSFIEAVTSTATVTFPSNGAVVTSASVMTGTITSPLPSSTALLYLDGSSVAFAQVDASSGSWSIPLAGIGFGSHAYSLSAGVGSTPGTPVAGTFTVTPPAGTLVKGSANTVYLVDGAGGLIPITSFSTVSDMGLSTGYMVVSDATISGLTVSGAALTNLVSCGGTTYLAAQGKLWGVPGSAIGSLAVETLPSTLCAVIPKSPVSLVAPVFIKGSAATIYDFTGGKKDAVNSYAGLVNLAVPNPPTWLTMNDGYVASIPQGPDVVVAGTLVKGSANTVYLVDGAGGLIPITSFSTVSDMGLSTGYMVVSDATISGLTVSGAALTNLVSCGGTTYLAAQGKLWGVPGSAIGSLAVETLPSTLCAVIPKSPVSLVAPVFIKGSAATIYDFTGGKKDAVNSYAGLVNLAVPNPPTWLTMNDGYVASIPQGPDVVVAGTLVKGSANTVYLVDGAGGLIPITSFSTVSDMGLSTGYMVVSDATISGLTVSGAALTNLVSCGGTTYLAAQGKLWGVPGSAIGSLAVETLPSTLCAVIPKSPVSLVAPVFIKGSAATIYDFTGGKKDAVNSYAGLVNLAVPNPPTWLTMNDGYVASIPQGPDVVVAGTLVKGSANTVYLVDGAGGLIPITSFSTVSDMGLSTGYMVVSDATISGLTVSGAALTNLVSCGGTTYLAAQGKLWGVPGSAIGSLAVETLPSTLCAVIPKSPVSLVAPVFIKGSAATIYELINGAKITMQTFLEMQQLANSNSPTWLTLNDAYTVSIPNAPTS